MKLEFSLGGARNQQWFHVALTPIRQVNMGPLVFAQDRKVSTLGWRSRRPEPGKRLWMGLRLLVVGPPGAGKMSLISVLSKALDPRISLIVFDLEAETEVQDVTLDKLEEYVLGTSGGHEIKRAEALVLRHLHRLSTERIQRVITVGRKHIDLLRETGQRARITLHATCFESPPWPVSVRDDLELLFPCQIHLSGIAAAKTDVSDFVMDVVGELNQRYGTRITAVESSVFDLLRRRVSWHASLHELRNVLERAYFQESTSCLSRRTMEAAAVACHP
jgi:energy-coupling factor transporter ATP-binding protein EcfA2